MTSTAAAQIRAQAWLADQDQSNVASVREAVGDDPRDIASELGYGPVAKTPIAYQERTCNGVFFKTALEAQFARAALAQAGVAGLHPDSPQARAALRRARAGANRLPAIGDLGKENGREGLIGTVVEVDGGGDEVLLELADGTQHKIFTHLCEFV